MVRLYMLYGIGCPSVPRITSPRCGACAPGPVLRGLCGTNPIRPRASGGVCALPAPYQGIGVPKGRMCCGGRDARACRRPAGPGSASASPLPRRIRLTWRIRAAGAAKMLRIIHILRVNFSIPNIIVNCETGAVPASGVSRRGWPAGLTRVGPGCSPGQQQRWPQASQGHRGSNSQAAGRVGASPLPALAGRWDSFKMALSGPMAPSGAHWADCGRRAAGSGEWGVGSGERAYQRPRWTTSLNGRRSGLRTGIRGRSAG
jgi:hypothetical protein